MIYKSVSSTDPWRSPQPIYTPTAAAEAEQTEQLQTQENHTASFQEMIVMYRPFCSPLKKELKLINLFLEVAKCSFLMTAE